MTDYITLDLPDFPIAVKLYIHPEGDHCVSTTLRQNHIWEAYETALVSRYVNAGDVFLDVGANLGYYAVLAGHLVGTRGQVLAYEPERRNFELLQRNIGLNQLNNVTTFHAALTDANGEGALYLNPDNFGDHQIYDNGESRHRQTIQLLNAYSHITERCEHINFVKLDTQGAEARIIESLTPLLIQNRTHLFMIVECWPAGLKRAGDSACELVERLNNLGMNMSIIDHLSHRLIPVDKALLLEWVNEVDSSPGNEGFINLLLGPASHGH